MKKLWFSGMLIILCAAGAAAQPKKLSIDMRFTTPSLDPAKDYFTWTADGKKTADKFDAARVYEHNGVTTTGASKAGSTTGFDAVYRDADKKTTLPVGVRHLCLFPVSPPATGPNDAFTIIPEGKAFVIRFFNRGVAYEIRTDEKGAIDVAAPGTAKQATVGQNIAGAFQLKPEFLKEGGDPKKMADADWTKISAALTADAPPADAKFTWTGKLAVAYAKNVLTVKGTLEVKK